MHTYDEKTHLLRSGSARHIQCSSFAQSKIVQNRRNPNINLYLLSLFELRFAITAFAFAFTCRGCAFVCPHLRLPHTDDFSNETELDLLKTRIIEGQAVTTWTLFDAEAGHAPVIPQAAPEAGAAAEPLDPILEGFELFKATLPENHLPAETLATMMQT